MTTTITTPVETAPAQAPLNITITSRATLTETFFQTMTFAWRSFLLMLRQPEQFFDVLIQPLLFTFMFAYIFGGAISGSVTDYLPLLIPGILAQTSLTACMAAGVKLREDLNKGVFDRFRSLPVARIAPLAGPMVADLSRYLIAAVLTFLTGIAMGYRPGGGIVGVTAAIILVVVSGWAMSWIFTWLGTLVRSATAVQGVSMMVMFPLTFLSNAFVPVETLPSWLRGFVNVNPVSHLVTAVRDLANDGAFSVEVLWMMLGCTVVIAIFAPLAVVTYTRKA